MCAAAHKSNMALSKSVWLSCWEEGLRMWTLGRDWSNTSQICSWNLPNSTLVMDGAENGLCWGPQGAEIWPYSNLQSIVSLSRIATNSLTMLLRNAALTLSFVPCPVAQAPLFCSSFPVLHTHFITGHRRSDLSI